MNIEQVAIFDCETTGLNPKEHTAIEVAVVRYNVVYNCVVECYSTLIDHVAGDNPAEAVNHIPAHVLPWGAPVEPAWDAIDSAASACDAVVAHNGDFDRQFVDPQSVLLHKPWIDTCNGITWPRQSKPGASLVSLCLDHGLGVVDPHRALQDCLMIARLLQRCAELGRDVGALLAQGLRPMATFRALVPYDDRDKAKAAAFRWDAASKMWLRKMAIDEATEEKLGFRVQQINPPAQPPAQVFVDTPAAGERP